MSPIKIIKSARHCESLNSGTDQSVNQKSKTDCFGRASLAMTDRNYY